MAVSDDAPEFSLERISRYGGFQIPLLSDRDHAVALAFGVWSVGPQGDAVPGRLCMGRSLSIARA